MKKYLKTIWPLVGIFALIYSLIHDHKYIYSILSVILALIILVLIIIPLMIIFRNIKISKVLFNYRFFWYYPSFFFLVCLVFGFLESKLRYHTPLNIVFIFSAVIGLVIGLVWGAKQRLKLKSTNQNDIINESLDLISFGTNNPYNEGILSLTNKKNLVFKGSLDSEIDIDIKNIKQISIRYEAKIFPIGLKIELLNGEEYLFNTDFPLVWKNVLSNQLIS